MNIESKEDIEYRCTVKHEYKDGKKLQRPEYWCGNQGIWGYWHFQDAQHLALSVGGSVQPCKECIKSIIKELEKEL